MDAASYDSFFKGLKKRLPLFTRAINCVCQELLAVNSSRARSVTFENYGRTGDGERFWGPNLARPPVLR